MIFPYMFSEIIKMCCIQRYTLYLTNSNGKYDQNGQYILYIPYKNMGIIVMSTTLLFYHPFCRNPNWSATRMLLLLFYFWRYGQTTFHSESLADVKQCWTNQQSSFIADCSGPFSHWHSLDMDSASVLYQTADPLLLSTHHLPAKRFGE